MTVLLMWVCGCVSGGLYAFSALVSCFHCALLFFSGLSFDVVPFQYIRCPY